MIINFTAILFIFTTFLVVIFLLKMLRNILNSSQTLIFLICIVGWLYLQAYLTISGFYSPNLNQIPPRFLLSVLPPILAIIILFNTKKTLTIIDSIDGYNLTILNVVRIPVEIGLYLLFLDSKVPEIMTFSGLNFDILAGISAPIIAIYGFRKNILSSKIIFIWNLISVSLLTSIVTLAFLSAPFPFQQLSFDQPNVAVFEFPFNWLPSFIVPAVLFTHIAILRKLIFSKKGNS